MDTNLSLNLGYTPNCKTPAHIFCDISCLTIILCIYLRAFQFLLNLILLLQGSQQISPANSSPVSFENNKLVFLEGVRKRVLYNVKGDNELRAADLTFIEVS